MSKIEVTDEMTAAGMKEYWKNPITFIGAKGSQLGGQISVDAIYRAMHAARPKENPFVGAGWRVHGRKGDSLGTHGAHRRSTDV